LERAEFARKPCLCRFLGEEVALRVLERFSRFSSRTRETLNIGGFRKNSSVVRLFPFFVKSAGRLRELLPTEIDSYVNRGILYKEIGQFEDALADYKESLRLEPNDLDTYHNRSIVYAALGKYDLAVEDLNKYLELVPDDADDYLWRAECYEAMGDVRAAKEDRQKYEELKGK
jgi:tetratricopeptide (TPR) repeat protein